MDSRWIRSDANGFLKIVTILEKFNKSLHSITNHALMMLDQCIYLYSQNLCADRTLHRRQEIQWNHYNERERSR